MSYIICTDLKWCFILITVSLANSCNSYPQNITVINAHKLVFYHHGMSFVPENAESPIDVGVILMDAQSPKH